MADEDKDLTEITEEEDPSPNCLLYIVIDPDGVPKPRKAKIENVSKTILEDLYGDLVSKTIAGGGITLSEGEYFIALTGEGDWEDSLLAITKTGGGHLRVGYPVVLTGKTGLSYNISVVGAGGLKIQRTFIINNEYDNITLIHRGGNIWQERGRATCG